MPTIGKKTVYMVAVQCNGIRHINEVKLCRTPLVLALVTTFGRSTIPVFIQTTQAHSAQHHSVSRCNEYRWWLRPSLGSNSAKYYKNIISPKHCIDWLEWTAKIVPIWDASCRPRSVETTRSSSKSHLLPTRTTWALSHEYVFTCVLLLATETQQRDSVILVSNTLLIQL